MHSIRMRYRANCMIFNSPYRTMTTKLKWILEFIFKGTSIRPEPGFVGSSLKNVTVPEGRDIILSCTVKNLDEHKVAWIHLDRSAILTVDKQVITRNARIGVSHEGRHTWNLHIRDVQRSDSGAYMCQINTAKAKTRMGHLSVVGKSYIVFPKIHIHFSQSTY